VVTGKNAVVSKKSVEHGRPEGRSSAERQRGGKLAAYGFDEVRADLEKRPRAPESLPISILERSRWRGRRHP